MARAVARPFQAPDLAVAAELLAARHRRDSSRIPAPAAALADPAACRAVLESLARSGNADGAVAESDGAVVGFLLGQRMMLAPDDFASQFVPPHSISIPVIGHAVAEPGDAEVVYREMYRLLSERWVAGGFFVHRWAIPAGDGATQDALVSLGFGRYLTAATRPVADPVVGEVNGAVEIRTATDEDIDVVMDLARTLARHHNRAPMFWPWPAETEAAAREFSLQALRSPATPAFLGYLDGRPAGMQTFLKPGFTPPIVEGERDIYLFEGIVEDDVQEGGVGTAILSHALRWAAEQGYETCTLHFSSQNYSGGPFWLKQGFVPVEHQFDRRIDERVAWARGKTG